MNNKQDQVLQLKVEFLKCLKSRQLAKAHHIASQIQQLDPTSALIQKCNKLFEQNKDKIAEIEKQEQELKEASEESEDEEEQEADDDDADPLNPNDIVEAEDVVEPMYDEQLYLKQKQRFLAIIKSHQEMDSEGIKQAITEAQE